MKSLELKTIGYEKIELNQFVAALIEAGVKRLVDVRERAQSRRRGFSKTALKAAVEAAGLEYFHFPELGDPKPGREAARAGDFIRFRRIFGDVLTSQAAQQRIAELLSSAQDCATCLMCYEASANECHRSMVAEAVLAPVGGSVVDIVVGNGRIFEKHRSVPAAYQGIAA